MNQYEKFWKNFKLRSELDIAGRFIYNGLKAFDEMRAPYHEGDVFEFLYNTSVGIERLLKVWIVLLEHDKSINQEEFEKSLRIHDHIKLINRIRKNKTIDLERHHWGLISLLSKFYKDYRYDRYNLISMTPNYEDKAELVKFIKSALNIVESPESPLALSDNASKIKEFIGGIIGRICEICYSGIIDQAKELNVSTHEIEKCSKAFKVFELKEYGFEQERLLLRELIVYFLGHESKRGKNVELLSRIEPLDFDPETQAAYLEAFESDHKKFFQMRELRRLYEDVEKPAERHAQLEEGVSEQYLSDEERFK